MDVGTGLALLGSKDLVVKLLGPTAEYIGEGVRYWTERGTQNVGRIFRNATQKLGDRINAEGAVPPKVLKGIISEGAFCEDELASDYFGGVLASSRSGAPRDDRGAVLVALMSRLSAYQIRTHYIFYTIVRSLFLGSRYRIGTTDGRTKMRTYVPFSTYVPAMAFEGDESSKWGEVLSHAMWGLCKEDLIGDTFATGKEEGLKRLYKAPAPGIVFEPATIGAELFLWAHGRGDAAVQHFLSPAINLHSLESVFIPSGYAPVPEEDAVHGFFADWPADKQSGEPRAG